MIPRKKIILHASGTKLFCSLSLSSVAAKILVIILCLLFFVRDTALAFPVLEHHLNTLKTNSVQHTTLTTQVDPASTIRVGVRSAPQVTPVVPQAILTSGSVQKALSSPIYPFPWDVRQQVGVLEMHQRFFFGGNPTLPEIALTFDDGPDPPYTSQILAVLKQYNVKATFFDVGHHVAEHPELVKQEFDEGHTVAIHSWDHVYLTKYSALAIDKQIGDTAALLKKTTGVQANFFRPPYGVYNATVLAEANKLGLTTFLWNDVASDWLLPGTTVISNRVINAARYGSIVLLHDGDGDHYNAIASREQTVQALPTIITTLKARGYHFVTLDQLVADMHK